MNMLLNGFLSLMLLFSVNQSSVITGTPTGGPPILPIFVLPSDTAPIVDTTPIFSPPVTTPNTTPLPSSRPPPAYSVTPDSISIPSLKIKSPIVEVNELTDTGVRKALVHGVGRFPNGGNYGEVGNVFIFGHSSNFNYIKSNYNKIFAPLPGIKLGAEIKVTANGNNYTYRVFKSFKVKPTDVWVLDSNPYDLTPPRKLLTLMTCFPIGTDRERWIVVAEEV